MNRLPTTLKWFIALAFTLYSCNCTRNTHIDDETVCDFFYDILNPSDYVKKTIEENVSYLIANSPVYSNDSLDVHIECEATWNVARTKDSTSIKIIALDTIRYYVTFDEGKNAERLLSWSLPQDRPILQSIKKILDTGTYTLQIFNKEIVPPLNWSIVYLDSIIETTIDYSFSMTR